LGWEWDHYQSVRSGLLAAGVLVPFRAHGGGIALCGRAEFGNARNERALYQPVAEVLVEITAAQGGRPTGGQWTRPDIVLAALRTYPYVPGRHLDVVTFEIKPARTLDVLSVFEALSHRRCATHAHVWVHAADVGVVVLRDAARHGIGLIAAHDPADFGTWRTLVAAQRTQPAPHELNEFLSQQLGTKARERLARWPR
jgi:hypothetical protein